MVIAAYRPENRRCRTVVGQVMHRARHQPFGRVSNGIENIGDDRERLRILVVVFLGILLIVVVVLRVRNCRQRNKKRGG